MLFSQFSSTHSQIIKLGAAKNASALINKIKQESSQPGSIDTAVRRDYYEGDALPHFIKYLHKVHPRAMKMGDIHPVVVNYVKTLAENDADIYRAGQPLRTGEDDQQTQRLSQLAKAAALDVILPDAEVKTYVARQMFLRCIRNPKTGKINITQHWPHDVWVIEDPAAPTELDEAAAVMIRISPEIYELWMAEEINGKRAWIAQQINLDKNNPTMVDFLEAPYYGRLPICSMHAAPLDSSPYLTDEKDFIELANNHMLAWTETFHLVAMQGHSPVYVTTSSDTISIESGPGGVTQLGPEDQMSALQVNPQIDQARELLADFTSAIARSRGQSSRAYSTKSQPLNSGVALRVENKIVEEKRPQRTALMAQFEREYLLPIIDEVERLMDSQKGVKVQPQVALGEISVTFPQKPSIEDPIQKQNRLQHAQQMKWISKARAAVEAGFYPNEEIALKMMPQDDVTEEVAGIDQNPLGGIHVD